MPKDAFAFPFRKPAVRNRFEELALPAPDSSIRHVFHARNPDAGPPTEDSGAAGFSPPPSPPDSGREPVFRPTDAPIDFREQVLRLLDLEFLSAELREGRGDLLPARFRAVRRALIGAGESQSHRPHWAARFVSRKSQTIWDAPRIEREIRRIQRRPGLLDRLREMETFIGREGISLTRHAGLPGFLRRHHRRCGGSGTGRGSESGGSNAPGVPLFQRPDQRPEEPHFPALIGVLDTGPGEAAAVAATPDGNRLLTADAICGAVLRCGATGRIRQKLAAAADAADLSEDGRWAALGRSFSSERRVTVHDARNGAQIFSAPCAGEFRLGGDGRRLLWQHPSGHLLRQDLPGPGGPTILWSPDRFRGPRALAISRDGRWAVSAPRSPGSSNSEAPRNSDAVGESRRRPDNFHSPEPVSGSDSATAPDFAIHVWDLDSGRCRHRFFAPGDGARFLALSADGRTAVSVGKDRALRIWNCRSGESRGQIELPRERATALAIAPDGRTALTAHSMGAVSAWDLRDRRRIKTMRTHFGSIRKISIVREGKRAFTLGGDGRIRRVDIQRGQAAGRPVHRSVHFLATSPDGKYAVGAGCLRFHRREIRIWDLAEGTPAARRIDLPAFPFRNVHISPRGNLALTVQPGSVRGWGIPSGSLEFHWEFDQPEQIARGLFAGNGERVVLLAREQYLFVGKPGDRRPSILVGDVIDMAPFPDSRHLLTLAGDRELAIWDLQRRVCVGRLPGGGDVREMVLSPGGNWLAEITRRGLLRLRSLRIGGTFFPLGGRVLAEPQIQFGPGDRRLVIAAEARRVGSRPESRLFSVDLGDAETEGGPIEVLPISLPFPRPLMRITPNGRGLAAAETGGREVRLLNLENGEPAGCVCLPADSAPLTRLGDFGADGTLPAALQDGRVIFLGVGGGYEEARPVSPLAPAEIRALDPRRESLQVSLPEPGVPPGKNAPSLSIPRRPRRKRRRPVLNLSPELRAAILSG